MSDSQNDQDAYLASKQESFDDFVKLSIGASVAVAAILILLALIFVV